MENKSKALKCLNIGRSTFYYKSILESKDETLGQDIEKVLSAILQNYKIFQSMSKKGSPWQNGYQESFFGNRKVDIGDVNRYTSLGELIAELYRSYAGVVSYEIFPDIFKIFQKDIPDPEEIISVLCQMKRNKRIRRIRLFQI